MGEVGALQGLKNAPIEEKETSGSDNWQTGSSGVGFGCSTSWDNVELLNLPSSTILIDAMKILYEL